MATAANTTPSNIHVGEILSRIQTLHDWQVILSDRPAFSQALFSVRYQTSTHFCHFFGGLCSKIEATLRCPAALSAPVTAPCRADPSSDLSSEALAKEEALVRHGSNDGGLAKEGALYGGGSPKTPDFWGNFVETSFLRLARDLPYCHFA
jgi:hypothetical protein